MPVHALQKTNYEPDDGTINYASSILYGLLSRDFQDATKEMGSVLAVWTLRPMDELSMHYIYENSTAKTN